MAFEKKQWVRGIVLVVLALWCITFLVSGYSLSSVVINDSLSESGDLQESMLLSLTNNTTPSLNMLLPRDAFAITVDGKLVTSGNTSLHIPTDCVDCQIRIGYALKGVVKEQKAKVYDFTRTISLPKTPASFSYAVKLPPGMQVNLTGENQLVPKNAQILTDGQGIIIKWVETNPELPKIYHVAYTGHEETEHATDELADEFSEWSVILLLGIAILIGIAVGWWVRSYGKKRPVPVAAAKSLPAHLFNPDEQAIIAKIKEAKGKIRQKELGVRLGWSKSKVSAVITNLEYKKVVRREKIGRNYDIYLEHGVQD